MNSLTNINSQHTQSVNEPYEGFKLWSDTTDCKSFEINNIEKKAQEIVYALRDDVQDNSSLSLLDKEIEKINPYSLENMFEADNVKFAIGESLVGLALLIMSVAGIALGLTVVFGPIALLAFTVTAGYCVDAIMFSALLSMVFTPSFGSLFVAAIWEICKGLNQEDGKKSPSIGQILLMFGKERMKKVKEFEQLQKVISSNLGFQVGSFDDIQLKKIYSYLARLIEAEKKCGLSANVVDDFIEKIGANLSARTFHKALVKSLDCLEIKDERVSRIEEVLSRVKAAKEEAQIEEIA